MKDDLKNVIMTFGLIALVFTQGSLAYQKKIHKEYVLSTTKQEEILRTNNEKVLANNLSLIQKQKIDLLKQQIAQNQLAILNSQNNSTSPVTNTQAQIDLARNQALLLSQQQAQAKALTQQQAQAKALAQQQAQALAQQQAKKVVTPARQSRAS